MNQQVIGWLRDAIEARPRPLHTVTEVMELIETGQLQLWTGERSCMVTEVSEWPSGEKLIESFLAAGDLDEIIAAVPQLESYARSIGCTQVELNGRRGWVRALKPFGYEEHTTIVRKLLK